VVLSDHISDIASIFKKDKIDRHRIDQKYAQGVDFRSGYGHLATVAMPMFDAGNFAGPKSYS
jgi:hypothetical protein